MNKELEYLINEIQENYKDQDLVELKLSLEKALAAVTEIIE
jgi:hypothetical protein